MDRIEMERFMRRALDLARRGWGETHPNPMVGAVIVEDDAIAAEGFHERAGEAHAEVTALRALGRKPKEGATMVVTLEPCSTAGRTGPCDEAIVEAGIRRVIVGATDPNPEHSGKGIERLREKGIEVVTGVLERDARDLNIVFNHWIANETPFFAAKMACTIDGKIATRTGESQWITGEDARRDVMRWRRLFPAIGVGAKTVMFDRPRLTSRIPGMEEWCPIRFVFDGLLRTAHEKELPSLYTDEFRHRTIVVTSEHAGTGYIRRLAAEGIQVWCLPSTTPKVPLGPFRQKCVEEGVVGVYIEGGSRLLSEMLQAKELNYMFSYRAPAIFADTRAKPVLLGLRTERLAQTIRLIDVRHDSFGDDQLMRGHLSYPEKLSVDEVVLGNE